MAGRRIKLSPEAQHDLEDIRDWTVIHFGRPMARRYGGHIAALLRRIKRDSSDWASQPEPAWGAAVRSMSIRRVFPRGQHRAIYEIKPDRIEVLRIVHLASRDSAAPELLED